MKNYKKYIREEYSRKFDDLMMNTFNYVMQEGEQIVQCKAPYPAYWFMSNKGYLFSAYGNKIKVVKPNHRYTGTKNKDGSRTGQDWYYEYKVQGQKHNKHVTMYRVMSDCFLENEFESDDNEIHHIRKKNQYKPSEGKECKRAENLQLLPREIHKNLTYYASKPDAEHNKEMEEKIKYDYQVKEFSKSQAGVRTVIVPEDYIWVIQKLKGCNPMQEYIFVNNKGKRMTTNVIRRRMERTCKQIHIKPKSPHKARRTFASILLDNNVDERMVIDLMGHTDIKCTEGYYHKNRRSIDRKKKFLAIYQTLEQIEYRNKCSDYLLNKKVPETLIFGQKNKAADGNRTRDLRLTKATLYRLSHSSMCGLVCRSQLDMLSDKV